MGCMDKCETGCECELGMIINCCDMCMERHFPANQQGLEMGSQEQPIMLSDDDEVVLNPIPDASFDAKLDDTIVIDFDEPELPPSQAKAPEKTQVQTTDFVFTLNNPTKRQIKMVQTMLTDLCSYAVFKGERGRGGTPHLQGFVQCKSKIRLGTLKAKFAKCDGAKPHIEKRMGTVAEADDYVRKPETADESVSPLWEVGKINLRDKQGKRTDLTNVYEMIKAGKDKTQILDAHPGSYIRYRTNIQGTIADVQGAKQRDTHELIIMFGSAGSGKSYTARQLAEHALREGETFAELSPDLSDYAQYGAPDIVLVEEFKGHLPLNVFKRIFDSGSKSPALHQRYSNVKYVARLTIITSNYHPRTWYDMSKVDEQAVYRRITECFEYSGAYGDEDDPVVVTPLECDQTTRLPEWWRNAPKKASVNSAQAVFVLWFFLFRTKFLYFNCYRLLRNFDVEKEIHFSMPVDHLEILEALLVICQALKDDVFGLKEKFEGLLQLLENADDCMSNASRFIDDLCVDTDEEYEDSDEDLDEQKMA